MPSHVIPDRMQRSSFALLGLLLLASCRPPEPGPPAVTGRFAEQVQAMKAELEAWQPWFEELAAVRSDRYDDVLCQRQRSQRLLWDDTLAAPLADASVLADPEACCGPLLTLVDFERQLQQVGVDLLVVVIPPVAAVYPELFGTSAPLDHASSPGTSPGGERPPLLDGRLRRFYAALQDAGVEVLDLLPTFLDHRYDGPMDGDRRELLFRWQDAHWTAWGSEVAGAAIADRVERYPWFEKAVASMGEALVEEASVVWLAQHGSIVRSLIKSGHLPADTPKERVRRVRVRIRGEQWSFEDRDSPVVLLGDSFSLPRFGLPDQLLRHLGFRVDSVTVAGGLPTGGPKALSFRGDRLAGKRLVIWEITSYALTEDWRPVDVLG